MSGLHVDQRRLNARTGVTMNSSKPKDCPHCWHVRGRDVLSCCGCGGTRDAEAYRSDVAHHPQHSPSCARTWQPAGICDCGGYKAGKGKA